jgi:hypothetical protein
MKIPGFTAETVFDADRAGPRRTGGASTAGVTIDGLVRPAMRCESSGDWNWCCARSSYCCLWSGDTYYGCGWSSPY